MKQVQNENIGSSCSVFCHFFFKSHPLQLSEVVIRLRAN
jgi:hypothetical protein